MDIDKLNLPEEVGEVMDRIVEFQIFCHSVKHEIHGFDIRRSQGRRMLTVNPAHCPFDQITYQFSIVSEGYGIIHVNKRSTV